MIHLRIVAPPDRAERALEMLKAAPAACNVISLPGTAHSPSGDVILCDVVREEASVILADLRELEIDRYGSIAIEDIDTELSETARRASRAAPGTRSDAVVWEEVESRTQETAALSASFMVFMVLATLIASVGIYLNTPILIIGAMVVGPEFGPLAGLCVAIVQRRRTLALRSAVALATGFPVAIAVAIVVSLLFRATGVTPDHFDSGDHNLSKIIASPDFFALFVALCAGVAGMLSLSTAKSGALIGVLISVTTIPAAANISVSVAYGDWSACRGSAEQLAINLGAIVAAGVLTLGIQRASFRRRQGDHRDDEARAAAGLPAATAGDPHPAVSEALER